MKHIKLTDKMKEISEFFKDLGDVYFVGGCVRDLLLNIEPHDYDIITSKTPDEIESYMKSKGKRVFGAGKRFGTLCCKVGKDNEQIEVTTFRKECYNDGTRKPKVEFTDSLIEDLKRRDFTINAVAANLDGKIFDPLQCRNDIKKKVLKAVGIPKHRFKEDPLRILRGIRFIGKYNLSVDNLTKKKLESCRWELYRISKERIIDEINKMLLLDYFNMYSCISDLWEYKIWQIVCPALQLQYDYDQNSPHHKWKLHRHTYLVVLAIKGSEHKNSLPHLWSGLLHDIGKPFTPTLHKLGNRTNFINHELVGSDLADYFCANYKFSNKDRSFIVESIKDHLNEESWLKPFDFLGKK